MARIRSTHPGQWTDEGFISCSPLARLLCLGIRNGADDQGIFEWKPATLNLRLLPVTERGFRVLRYTGSEIYCDVHTWARQVYVVTRSLVAER